MDANTYYIHSKSTNFHFAFPIILTFCLRNHFVAALEETTLVDSPPTLSVEPGLILADWLQVLPNCHDALPCMHMEGPLFLCLKWEILALPCLDMAQAIILSSIHVYWLTILLHVCLIWASYTTFMILQFPSQMFQWTARARVIWLLWNCDM